MIGYSGGGIILGDRVIDLYEFKVRPKTTDQDLEAYYDSFIGLAEQARNDFDDRKSFDKVLADVSGEKRPKLALFNVPFISGLYNIYFVVPKRPYVKQPNEKYFIGPRCSTAIPVKGQDNKKSLEKLLQKEIFRKHPGYEGIIEIPNNLRPPETKAATFYQSMRYLALRYWAEKGGLFLANPLDINIPDDSRNFFITQTAEKITDRLLEHDPDAQFEYRCKFCYDNQRIEGLSKIAAISAVVILRGFLVIDPLLAYLASASLPVQIFLFKKYRNFKREEILSKKFI